MSLNGLDGAAVAEAHQAALADAGGWFLLKYVARDTVELLQKGTGGVQEVRGVVAKYEEKSPLYGLVQYRRKKVILKYVPEGTSRLLQVRLTVQFQSVLETFTPHDTVFSFTTPAELTESALGMCTMLLPAPSSLTSSSSSLRRRRLNEISEDAEETTPPTEAKTAQNAQKPEDSPAPTTSTTFGRRELDELPASAVLAKALLAKRKEQAAAAAAAAAAAPTDDPAAASTEIESLPAKSPRLPRKESLLALKPPSSPLPPSIADKALPATPESTPPTTSEGEAPKAPDFEATSNILLEATTATANPAEPTAAHPHARHLSAAESDSISQWSSNVASFTSSKSKKKLGPRPHIDPGHRPKTSGTTDSNISRRPVANLPNSIRVNNKPLIGLSLRPGSQQSSRSVPGRFAPSSLSVNGAPPLPSPSHLQSLYKPGESRPTISRPASVTGDASTATPEKLRLMKALQLRKRNMLLAQRASTVASSAPSNAHIHKPSDSSVSTNASSHPMSSIPSQEQLSNIDEESKLPQSSSTTSPTFTTNISEEQSTKASSFSEQDDGSRMRRSLSSATSSSVTPKAPIQEIKAEATVVEPPKSAVGVDRSGPKIPNSAVNWHEQTPARPSPTTNVIDIKSPDGAETSFLEQTVKALGAVNPEAAAPLSFPESPDKAKQLPRPLQLQSGGDASASEVSEDDSLMDELQNATVHEAKPISVARSPVTPIMSKGSSDRLRDYMTKTSEITQPTRRSAATTPDRKSSGSIRSVSTALPTWPPLPVEPVQVPLTKKPTLGTGISKRIKALEVLTTKDTSPPQAPQPGRDMNAGRSGFSSFMKRSSFLLNQQQVANASTETSPPKQMPVVPSHYDPNSSAAKESQRPPAGAHRPLQKGETISVTARIVRDPSSKHPPISPSSNYHTPLNLYRSPLIVEHETHDPHSIDQALASVRSTTKSPTKSERGRFSFSSHRSASHANLPRSESIQSKVSKTSGYKKNGPRSASDAGSFSEERSKSSMTSRLMKRMSNLTSPRSKNQPTNREDSQQLSAHEPREHARENSITESLLHVVDIGDVNVQFPESFLWKRRFMRIDDQGYLIFSPPVTDAHMKSVSRKYHLSDFKRPALPDLEREEMAWSVILDLKDGRCVQCACEGKQAQQQVLQLLVDAHSAYHQLYGAE